MVAHVVHRANIKLGAARSPRETQRQSFVRELCIIFLEREASSTGSLRKACKT